MASKNILDLAAARADLTITLASLASSVAGVGRQSTIVDNTATKYTQVDVILQVKTQATTAASSVVSVYLIRDDGNASPKRTDAAGASDAGLTQLNAELIGTLTTGATTAAQTITGIFPVLSPGPKWGILVVNSTGTTLDTTAGNHYAGFVGHNRTVG